MCGKVSQTVFQEERGTAWPLRRAHRIQVPSLKPRGNTSSYISLWNSPCCSSMHTSEEVKTFTSAALKLVVVGPGFLLTKAYRSTEAGPCRNLPAWFLAANTGMGNTPLGPSRMTSVSHMGPWTDSKQSFSQNYANCTSSNRCVTKPR